MSEEMTNVIKELMDAKNISTAKLAREAGMNYQTMYSIVTGKVNWDKISIDSFIRIAKALGVKADDLYFGEFNNDAVIDEIITIYEAMSVEGKKALLITAKSFLEMYSDDSLSISE